MAILVVIDPHSQPTSLDSSNLYPHSGLFSNGMKYLLGLVPLKRCSFVTHTHKSFTDSEESTQKKSHIYCAKEQNS